MNVLFKIGEKFVALNTDENAEKDLVLVDSVNEALVCPLPKFVNGDDVSTQVVKIISDIAEEFGVEAGNISIHEAIITVGQLMTIESMVPELTE